MVTVKRATLEDIEKLKVASGFTKWVSTSNDKGKEELKQLLKSRLKDGMDVWLAIDGDEIVGFTIISDWPALPGAKAIEAIEVARSYRGKGVGSMMLSKIIGELDTLIALMPSPEEGYEEELKKFYERFGFRYLTEDYMVRIPDDEYKLRRWMEQVDRLLEIYQVLLKEMKIRHDMIYEKIPRMAGEKREESS